MVSLVHAHPSAVRRDSQMGPILHGEWFCEPNAVSTPVVDLARTPGSPPSDLCSSPSCEKSPEWEKEK